MDLSTLLKQEVDLLLRIPIKHKIKDVEIEINTLTVSQLAQINPYLIEIGAEDIALSQSMIESFDYAKLPDMVTRCIEPMKKIIEIITGNDQSDIATLEDYFILFALIFSRMGNANFQKSIILITKRSPTRRTEIIAGQKFLTSLN